MSENPQFWNAASSSLLPLATTYGGCTPANLSLTLLTLIHLCRLHTLTKRPPCHHTFGRSARMISTCARQQTESRHTHTRTHTHAHTRTHTHPRTHAHTHTYTHRRARHTMSAEGCAPNKICISPKVWTFNARKLRTMSAQQNPMMMMVMMMMIR